MHWREGKGLPPGEQRLAGPYDPDARYGVKRWAGRTGCKVHPTETCEPDPPHLIVNAETTAATVDDAEMTAIIHQRLAGRRLAPAVHAVDAGYVSAGHILAARDDHGITLPGPAGADTTRAQRDGKDPFLPRDAFKADRDARKVTCPQGRRASSGPASGTQRHSHRTGPLRARRLRCPPAAGQVHQGR